MITRHHLTLGLTCGLIPFTVLATADPIIFICLLAGTCIGTILPDIHMKKPATFRLLTPAWYLVQTGRRVITPLMYLLISHGCGIRTDPDDKRLTHSILGIALYGIVYTSPALAVGILPSGHSAGLVLLAFSGGVFFGMIVHLAQDLCCRKGISPLYPLSNITLYGSIRPCDIHDPRITRFHIQHIVILVVFQLVCVLAILPDTAFLSWGILCIVLCIVSMIWQSDIRIERNRDLPSAVKEGIDA